MTDHKKIDPIIYLKGGLLLACIVCLSIAVILFFKGARGWDVLQWSLPALFLAGVGLCIQP